MWIITHDNVHEAACNPSLGVIKSKDYITRRTRKKGEARRHEFKLLRKGAALFYGVAHFGDDATDHERLRPLNEFGRSIYDCDEIQYMSKYGWISLKYPTM